MDLQAAVFRSVRSGRSAATTRLASAKIEAFHESINLFVIARYERERKYVTSLQDA